MSHHRLAFKNYCPTRSILPIIFTMENNVTHFVSDECMNQHNVIFLNIFINVLMRDGAILTFYNTSVICVSPSSSGCKAKN